MNEPGFDQLERSRKDSRSRRALISGPAGLLTAEGPPAAIFATLLLVMIAPEVGPGTPGPLGNMTAKDELMFFLAWGGIGVVLLIALVFALLGRVGVRRGQR